MTTYDRELAKRLIDTVSPRHRAGGDLGLTVAGELADQLEAAGKEIDGATTQRDAWRQQAEDNALSGDRIHKERDKLRVDLETTGRELRDVRDTLEVVRKASIERGQEADLMRPVVEAADAWRDLEGLDILEAEADDRITAGVDRLIAAVDAYRARKAGG